MAKQTINPGTAPTGAGGDTFRSGSAKLQANDDELYAALGASGGVLPAALPLTKGGTGAATAAAARTNLGLGTAATATLTTSGIDMTLGRVLKTGDFGVGRAIGRSSFAEEISATGFYATYSPSPIGTPNGCMGAAVSLSSLTNRTADMFLSIYDSGGNLLSAPRLHFRNGSNGSWIEVRNSANTTVDANGFIKNASPIVQLFADKIEMNDEAQQQNIEFEKLGVGDYLIKGSSGFAQEGWYIETPKDANGNLLVAVVYEQLANGDISVKTYDYMLNNKGRIVADTETPLDIPETRWIDLRLQELLHPEIEVTDDPEQ